MNQPLMPSHEAGDGKPTGASLHSHSEASASPSLRTRAMLAGILAAAILTWEMAAGWQTFTQIASQFEPVDRERVQPLFERAREGGLLRSDFMPTIQFMMLVPWCQIYLGYLPLYRRLVPNEDLAAAPRLADAREYLVDFIVAGMMYRLPETKPEKEG